MMVVAKRSHLRLTECIAALGKFFLAIAGLSNCRWLDLAAAWPLHFRLRSWSLVSEFVLGFAILHPTYKINDRSWSTCPRQANSFLLWHRWRTAMSLTLLQLDPFILAWRGDRLVSKLGLGFAMLHPTYKISDRTATELFDRTINYLTLRLWQ